MDRRTKICIWIILIGLGNFLAYSLVYVFIGGEAASGAIRHDELGRHVYFLKGPGQDDVPVSKAVYVYSGIHSITIWVTVGAVMLAMLTLAKERIVSSMRSTVVRGRTLITILATVITLTTTVIAIWFTLQFTSRFYGPLHPAPAPPRSAPPAATSRAWN
jgi:heme/copper-type cytochrome/quinol oxidase subunit 2